LLPGVAQDSAAPVITRLLTVLLTPILVEGESVRIGASCGRASWPQNGATREALFRHADLELYARKPGRRAAA
jgi:predicted signal transduction protein with EAL and GGDEF domain